MTSTKEKTVHVITSVERRRRWLAYDKKAIVEESYEAGKTVSSVAREYGVSPSQVFAWRRKMEEGALIGVGTEERVVPESSYKQALDRIKRLERLLGLVHRFARKLRPLFFYLEVFEYRHFPSIDAQKYENGTKEVYHQEE